MTALANAAVRVVLLCFLSALFLTGCVSSVVHRIQRPPSCDDDCWQRVRDDLDAAMARRKLNDGA